MDDLDTPLPLRLNSFFDDLPDMLRRRVIASGTVATYPSGANIHLAGDTIARFSVVESGGVRFSRTDREGQRHILTNFAPGQAFGELTLFGGLPRAYDAEAVGKTKLRHISRVRLDALMHELPELRDQIIRHITRQLAATLVLLEDERSLPLHIRLAKQLAAAAVQKDDRNVVEMRQSDLADLLAVSLVSLNKALGKLAATNLIETGYGRIIIPSLRNLILLYENFDSNWPKTIPLQ